MGKGWEFNAVLILVNHISFPTTLAHASEQHSNQLTYPARALSSCSSEHCAEGFISHGSLNKRLGALPNLTVMKQYTAGH